MFKDYKQHRRGCTGGWRAVSLIVTLWRTWHQMSQLSSSFLPSQTCESSAVWPLQINPSINKNHLYQFGYLILGMFVNVSLDKSSSQPSSDFKCLKPSLCVPMVQSVFVMLAFNSTCYLLSHFLLMKGGTAARAYSWPSNRAVLCSNAKTPSSKSKPKRV